jgi:prepilin-type N-terminal cleavage/methylation domain-containing protein
MTHTRHQSRRAGFTLIELLVVIAIIGVLAGLLTGGIIMAYNTSRSFVIANEISQVEIGLEQFKAKFGCYPPDMSDFSNSAISDANLKAFNAFINQAYPRSDRAMISTFRQWVLNRPDGPGGVKRNQIDQAEALVLFLALTSNNPRYPFGTGDVTTFNVPHADPAQQNSLNVFMEIPPTALADADGDGFYEFSQKAAKGAPLVYFDARIYTLPTVMNGTIQVGFNAPAYVNATGVVTPYASQFSPPSNYIFFSPKSYQLISAGQDGEFGVILTPGTTAYPTLSQTAAIQAPRVPETDGDNIASFSSKKTLDSFTAQ